MAEDGKPGEKKEGGDRASGMEKQAVDVRDGSGEGKEVHLVRDLLDKQLGDKDHDPLGRADGVVLVLREAEPPRVAALECGLPVVADRLHRRLGWWVRAAGLRWGLRRGRTMRVPWAKVKKVGIETELDLEADLTEALTWEHWLRDRVVGRIPSLKPKNKKQKEKTEEGQKDQEGQKDR